MRKSLVGKLRNVAIAALGGLAAACSSISVDSIDGKFTEEVRNKYAASGFLISKNPAALTTVSAGANTNIGRASVYGTDITCRHDSHPHEYDLGGDFSRPIDDEENWTASIGFDRYMFPNIGELDASNEVWAALNRRNLPGIAGKLVDSATLKYINASLGSGEGDLYKLGIEKTLTLSRDDSGLTRDLPFTLGATIVRNQGYFIGRGNGEEFLETTMSVPLYVADDESFRFDLGIKRIDSFGNDHLTDTTNIGITLTIPLFNTANKKADK